VFLSYEIAQAYEQIFRIREEFSQQPYRRKLAPEFCDDGRTQLSHEQPAEMAATPHPPNFAFRYVLETGRIILQDNSAVLSHDIASF